VGAESPGLTVFRQKKNEGRAPPEATAGVSMPHRDLCLRPHGGKMENRVQKGNGLLARDQINRRVRLTVATSVPD